MKDEKVDKKRGKYKFFLFGIFIVILIVICIIIYKLVTNRYIRNDGEILINTSEKLKECKMVDGIEVKDISLTKEGSISNLTVTINNSTSEESQDFNAKFIFVDKKGNEITSMTTYIPILQPNESTQIELQAKLDFVEAYDFRIEKLPV